MAAENASDEYKWTDVDTAALISWRSTNEGMFTGRRNAAQKGFEEFIKVQGLEGKMEATKIKRKWENLKQKYKELKAPRTGVSTEGGETTAASWKWYGPMDEALGGRPSISPPVLVDSSAQDVAVVSPPSVHPSTPNLGKRKRESEWQEILKEIQEKEEERELIQIEREERREREAIEREDRKERERLQREERKAKEMLEREERREGEPRGGGQAVSGDERGRRKTREGGQG
ncbi:TBC1 domain family member 10B-like [Gadus morhua]|uniref:TBC1 domain family member 10B-like n=1 Tax=Gadus morhua TaxID=8049 RepID=UPI0011B67351|nr:TBC1 domain family member 10B-like [Gadus morhua]